MLQLYSIRTAEFHMFEKEQPIWFTLRVLFVFIFVCENVSIYLCFSSPLDLRVGYGISAQCFFVILYILFDIPSLYR